MGDIVSKKDKNFIKETANNKIYTYADYLSWTDNRRYELIDGQVYIMTPAPSSRHQKILIELIRQISMYLFDKECEVYSAPFDVIFSKEDEKSLDALTVVQPDILVICDKNKIKSRGCEGAPDFIIEIISPSSGGRDRKEKRNLYERQGVKEYWIVDYNENTLEVYLLNEDNKYGKSAVYIEGDKVSVNIFSDLEIDLSYVFRE